MFRSKVRIVHMGIISVFRRSWASKQAFSLTSVSYPPDLDMARQSQQTFDLSLQRSSPTDQHVASYGRPSTSTEHEKKCSNASTKRISFQMQEDMARHQSGEHRGT